MSDFNSFSWWLSRTGDYFDGLTASYARKATAAERAALATATAALKRVTLDPFKTYSEYKQGGWERAITSLAIDQVSGKVVVAAAVAAAGLASGGASIALGIGAALLAGAAIDKGVDLVRDGGYFDLISKGLNNKSVEPTPGPSHNPEPSGKIHLRQGAVLAELLPYSLASVASAELTIREAVDEPLLEKMKEKCGDARADMKSEKNPRPCWCSRGMARPYSYRNNFLSYFIDLSEYLPITTNDLAVRAL